MRTRDARRRFLRSRGWFFVPSNEVGCGHRGAWTKAPYLYCTRCNRGTHFGSFREEFHRRCDEIQRRLDQRSADCLRLDFDPTRTAEGLRQANAGGAR